MTDHEKLKRDIETLRESIRMEWQEVEGKDLSESDRLTLMDHIQWCVNELELLHRKFADVERFEHRGD